MANQITPEHENLFQTILKTVDNAGTRVALSHVWDVLKEVVGVAVPVVEATVPGAAPVVAAAEVTVEDLDQQIQALLDQKAQKMAASQPAPPAAS
jgi:hypothetical protein